MHRLIYVILLILVVTALIGGIRIGKQLQMIDTPVKTVQKNVQITNTPQALVRYKLPCGFFFSVPKNISAHIASTSATITFGKNTLNISCVPIDAKISSESAFYKNIVQNSAVTVQGEKTLFDLIESGFDPRYVKTVR